MVRFVGTANREHDAETQREYPELGPTYEVEEFEVTAFDSGQHATVTIGEGLIECLCPEFQRRYDCEHVAALAQLEQLPDYRPSHFYPAGDLARR
jgi:hypothetical protein